MKAASILGLPKNPDFNIMTPRRSGFLLLNVLFGILFSTSFNPLQYYCYGLVAFGSYKIAFTKNKSGIAHLLTAYVIGMEVFLRAIKTDIPWQYGKYSLILFLSLGYYFERQKPKLNTYYILYFILLLPSILVVNPNEINIPVLEIVLASLSGPATLFVSAIYFHKKAIIFEEFKLLIFYIICGLTPCLILLVKNFFSLQNIEFTETSNFATSAGFGPNQISTALGMGIIIMYFSNVFEIKLLWKKVIDNIIWIIFIGFSILTFSRGGIFSAIISIFFAILYFQFKRKSKKVFIRSLVISCFTLFIFMLSIIYLNNFSRGMLYERYFLKQNEDPTEYLTGRDQIFYADIYIFLENILLGVGPGMGLVKRADYGLDEKVAAHNEFTRMVAEHGLFGLISLGVLLLYPLTHFKKVRILEVKIFFICTMAYSLLTMGHSSMRLALVGFLYGVSFINIYFQPIQPQPTLRRN